MKTTEPTNKQWKDFCQRVIDTKGNPSTKDAEETGVSFTYWFEFVTRIKTDEQRVERAKFVLDKLERMGY